MCRYSTSLWSGLSHPVDESGGQSRNARELSLSVSTVNWTCWLMMRWFKRANFETACDLVQVS